MPWKNHNPIESMPQYYKNYVSDWGVDIPTTDEAAYSHPDFSNYRIFYNKMHVCETQNIPNGPIGTNPIQYPIILKPVFNLRGGGMESQVVHNREQYESTQLTSLFWSPYVMGEHYSIDLILRKGEIVDHYCIRGEKLQHGMFDYWELIECPDATYRYV